MLWIGDGTRRKRGWGATLFATSIEELAATLNVTGGVHARHCASPRAIEQVYLLEI